MSNRYFTILSTAEGEYKEKGSKFLSFAFPVSSEADIKEKQEGLRKEYYDARHHCYAYILGTENQTYRANDDGEPGHSAGDPILGQIRSFGLTDCLIVVVRYFGGTKLGVSGLVNAYKTAAAEALESAKKKEIILRTNVEIQFDYPALGKVEKWAEDFNTVVSDRNYANTCVISLQIENKHWPFLQSKIEESPGISYKVISSD